MAMILPLSSLLKACRPACAAAILAIFCLALPSFIAADEPAVTVVKRPAGETIVPDKFLRRWDPVTIFFDNDKGSAKGGAEHAPEQFVTMDPPHPGAFIWLNARTLQFRPAEPWTPLTRIKWTVGDKTVDLVALMTAPVETVPANGASGLAPVERIDLVLPEPVNVEQLKHVLRIELRTLPGITTDAPRLLAPNEYEIKIGERSDRNAPVRYTLVLRNPIPGGTQVTLRLNLSPDSALNADFYELNFTTRMPFRIVSVGCANAAPAQAVISVANGEEDAEAETSDESSTSHRRHHRRRRTVAEPGTTAGHPADSAPIPAAGVEYARDDALTCGSEDRSLLVQFSARLKDVTPVIARNLVRVTPAVDDLSFLESGDTLVVKGKFKTGVAYRLGLEAARVQDAEARALVMPHGSQLYFTFAAQGKLFRWDNRAQALIERFGPQTLPIQARGYENLDLRIHRIDPFDLNFWPMDNAIETDDQTRPPGPGEEPGKVSHEASGSALNITGQIAALGSPSLSGIVRLPLQTGDNGAKFGLDVAPLLARISGAHAPGTYLVGARVLDDTHRHWIRLQVTDLNLSTIEEDHEVRFVVTSLKSADPVAGAKIMVDNVSSDEGARPIVSGETDAKGTFIWTPSPSTTEENIVPNRIRISKGADRLAVDFISPPPRLIHPAVVRSDEGQWLRWSAQPNNGRDEAPTLKCHIFPERPIYRPEEPVHIKGYARTYAKGVLTPVTGKATLLVTGPNNLEWRYPVELGALGSFHYMFNEKTDVTDEFQIHLEVRQDSCGEASFRKEAYRLPDFEVHVTSPDTMPLDAPFPVHLTATYFAGGTVAERPVRWRVTQFPYTVTLKRDKGYLYSTDTRFAAEQPFESSAALEQQGKTDDKGAAEIKLDPSIEKTDQPRRYVVEATVTGADDHTVTDTHEVVALPSFVLGLKIPRYFDHADTIAPEIVAITPDGAPVADQRITVRLKERQWHSILQASDFSSGVAKYQTDTVDELRAEKTVMSRKEPLKLNLPVAESGVYVVEIEAQDRQGRRQSVSVDLFVSGDAPVTWSRPPAAAFKATADKDNYAPGESAKIVLESPFQTAKALAMVEEPDGHARYSWVDVRNGAGVLSVPIEKQDMPGIPVHILLMRGRLEDDGAATDMTALDLRKPETVVANLELSVRPVKNIVKVDLTYPEKVQPGDDIDLTVRLSDDANHPIAGEVTLWLIDSAVLSLRKEGQLDPLPSFTSAHPARLSVRDMRNLTIGRMPFEEMPGGDGGNGKADILDITSIRKNFTPLPYYEPALMVDASGKATVHIHMPDNLTNYKIRAIAISGNDRFGFGTGKIIVRLPVQVQQSLPRFVRPGDSFTLSALGRTIDGIGGAGKASLRTQGIAVSGGTTRDFRWQDNLPARIDFPASVANPTYGKDGKPLRTSVNVTLGIERMSDSKRDAFSVNLPLLPDRRPTVTRVMGEVKPDKPFTLPAVSEDVRESTLRRSFLFASNPFLVRLGTSLDYMLDYPFGCTEQRISRARAEIAAKRLHEVLTFAAGDDRVDNDVKTTLTYLTTVVNDDGLAGFWPGSTPSVALTAWVAQFMTEAKGAGYSIDSALYAKVLNALKQSLRSDSPFLHPGAAYAERVWALLALDEAGQADKEYADELARRANMLNVESVAQILRVLDSGKTADNGTIKELRARLWKGLVFRLDHGGEVYGGLQDSISSLSPDILPSEARTLAQIIRATSKDSEDSPHRSMIINALLRSAGNDGWGDTNANAEASLALVDLAAEKPPQSAPALDIAFGTDHQHLAPEAQTQAEKLVSFSSGPVKVTADAASGKETSPIAILAETSYVSTLPGSSVAASAQGFVVSRTASRIVNESAEKLPLDKASAAITLKTGDVVEDALEVVNPEDRHFIAVVMPLAAGMEPLNPALATAPPEAAPTISLTLKPAYTAFLDDQVAYYFDELPKGTYRFAFRARAAVAGKFTQPAAFAESMYHEAVNGNSNGATIVITRPDQDNDAAKTDTDH